MDFANAKQIFINNKEVNILSLNNEVIWQKTNLVVTSNKSTIQTGETATLTATLTHGGTGVSGELIIFETDKPSTITTDDNTSSYTMTGDYKITIPENKGGEFISITKYDTTGSIIFAHNIFSEKYYIEVNQEPIYLGSNILYVIGNSLYYTDEDGEFTELDVSDYDTSVIDNPFYNGGVEIETDVLSDVTDANGVATVSYVGKGAGVLSIRAIYENMQSGIYSLIDAIFYDEAKTSLSNEFILTNITPSSNGTYTELSKTNSSNRGDCVLDCSLTSEFAVEWDNYGVKDSANYFTVYDSSNNSYFTFHQKGIDENTHVKLLVTASQIRIFVDNEEKTAVTANYTLTNGVDLRLRMNTGSTNSIKLANFKVYLI